MRVLVAADLSDRDAVALREGMLLTPSPGDELAVIHVLTRERHEAPAALEARDSNAARRLAAELKDVAPLRRVQTFIDTGAVGAAVVQRAAAWSADVVVTASAGRDGVGVGHVTDDIARHAACDVLVARPRKRSGAVLAATDLLEPSYPAITTGAREAIRRQVRLEVVRVLGLVEIEAYHLLTFATPGVALPADDYEDQRTTLAHLVEQLGVQADCKVLDRPAARAITNEAKAIDAELVVVTSALGIGLPGLHRLSLAYKVLRTAPCSILLVRPRPRTWIARRSARRRGGAPTSP